MSAEIEWRWHLNPNHVGLMELRDSSSGLMLAWVQARPPYCDRGHFQSNVECVSDLDPQDGYPRYFMRLEVAQQETVDFLRWRLLRLDVAPRPDAHAMLLARIEELMQSDPPADSPDGIRLDELAKLCEAYEKAAFPI